ncbi:MAG: hypothetical protein C0623_05330 [Desulfuromonas sp.]|nr:MAG: hypothetical protein C0623_05330 [Desulfuromonas sp.]
MIQPSIRIILLAVLLLNACATLPPPDPKRSATLHEEALRSVSIGNYATAVRKFAEAIRYNPMEGNLYLQQAEVFEFLQDFAEAERVYELGLDRLPPGHEQRERIHYRLGLVQCRDKNKLNRARAHLDQLADPSQRADLEGMILLQSGQPDDALFLFSEALKSAPDYDHQARIYYHASLAHFRRNDLVEAKNALFHAVNNASSLALKQHITIFFDQIR